MKIYNHPSMKERRKELRTNSTEAECALWGLFRNRQFQGLKFFRQYSINHHIVDLYCPEKKLVIEIDGGHHYFPENKLYDETRTKYFEELGLMVLRFTNNEVLENLEGVREHLRRTLEIRQTVL